MRKWLLMVVFFAAAASLRAQSTNAPLAVAQPVAQTPAPVAVRPMAKPTRPNEAVIGKVVASGVGVQIVKTKNPLQLINPFAGPEYGAARDNLAWNPINSAPAGVKVFAIHF